MVAPVIGRKDELATATEFLGRFTNEPAALVVGGEAGIGKTTLWGAILEVARGMGCRVLAARPAESERELSYAALTDLIGPAYDEVRTLLPPPQERGLAAALLREAVPQPTSVRTLGAATTALLGHLSEAGRIVLAVDDLQWIDAVSERVLAFAIRRLPPGVDLVVTFRTEGQVEPPLGLEAAYPSDRLLRVALGPLSIAALHHLILERLGSSFPRPVLARLRAASGGNPFFALEMARPLRLDPGGALSTPLTVPPGLRELAAERIDPLSTSAREVVIAAAALFRPTVAEVAASLNRPNEIESDLLEAERAGILTSHEGRIRFTHPLIASAAYGSAPDAERRRLHRRLAEVVRDPEERARHLARCATEADSWTASEIERAARRAAFGGAQDAAAELFDAAVRLTPQDEHDERARRLLGQAAALNAVGDFAAARALAEQAHDSARAGATQVAVCALLANLAWFAGDARTATSYLEDASRASGDDDELRGATQAKLVRYTFTDDFARAVAHADEAIPLLPEDTQPFLLAHILIDRFFGSVLLGRPSPRRTFDRALRLEEAALRTAVEPPHPIPLIWFLCVDEFDAAQARFHLEHEWYRDRGEEIWQANRLAHVALVELRSGRWEVAERYVEESCAALEEVEVHGPMALVFEKRALVDAHLGRADRGRETLLPLIDEFERRGQAYWAALCLSTLAFVEFSAGDHAATDRALSRMREHTDRLGIKDNIHDRSEPFHIESLLALGETNHARRVLAELESRQRVLPRPWIAATLPRAQALVAAADGDVDGALRRLEVADPHLDGLLPFEHGWTLLVDGRLLRRAKRKRAAADALDRAREIFERLGAASWVERVRAESSRLGIRPSAPLELTESERRVAELVARGLRNREVATRLFMSPKTVEANLGRVYRKLGIHSRAELGAELAGGPDPPAAP